MDKKQAIWRAISALQANNERATAKVLEDDLKITGSCQYGGGKLVTQVEVVTLLDSCERCGLVEGIHPVKLKSTLLKALDLHETTTTL